LRQLLFSLFNIDKKEFSSELSIKKEIIELQTKLDEIGEVNLLAFDEYNEIKKRYDFLVNQKKDVLKSIDDLNIIIKKLEISLNEKFYKAFVEIRENFKKIFKSIFGGGKAELYLIDPDNLLETGVDIKIQPPGKKITHLNLLSGGEKTMSAIALLFPLFLYRPSPFCIMDEIDAPLDENNVLRFKKLLQDFSKNTQFIIISHNKITLEVVNVLYGITMEEEGVSKVVSAKLENN